MPDTVCTSAATWMMDTWVLAKSGRISGNSVSPVEGIDELSMIMRNVSEAFSRLLVCIGLTVSVPADSVLTVSVSASGFSDVTLATVAVECNTWRRLVRDCTLAEICHCFVILSTVEARSCMIVCDQRL